MKLTLAFAQAQLGIVCVSLNYRTHALGFLATPELTHGDPRGVSGNYGPSQEITARSLKLITELRPLSCQRGLKRCLLKTSRSRLKTAS